MIKPRKRERVLDLSIQAQEYTAAPSPVHQKLLAPTTQKAPSIDEFLP